MDNDLIQVTKLVIKVGEIELVVTPDQARRLRDALNGLLGEPQTVIWPSTPYSPAPIWCNPNSETWPGNWQINYGPLGQSVALTINA